MKKDYPKKKKYQCIQCNHFRGIGGGDSGMLCKCMVDGMLFHGEHCNNHTGKLKEYVK